MHMVAEGVKSTPSVLALAARAGVEMPIAEEVHAVLTGARTPVEGMATLMLREAKAELDGIGLAP
jgi:glycerol-3-phosphate dehydrogenase (NAD(P)+)